jgi:NAD(P)-dependent dehydrogenase (short-subunit alcohol dehydrogenase family)
MDMPIEYSFVKGGIISMTRALATKYAPVRVNCVSPGGVFDGQDEKFVKRYCEKTPLGRMATPEDVANAVVFLASDKAAYITGQNIVIDGGYTIQ